MKRFRDPEVRRVRVGESRDRSTELPCFWQSCETLRRLNSPLPNKQLCTRRTKQRTVRNIVSREQRSSPSIDLQRTSNARYFDHARRHVHERRIIRTEALARPGVNVEQQGITSFANEQPNVIGPRKIMNLQIWESTNRFARNICRRSLSKKNARIGQCRIFKRTINLIGPESVIVRVRSYITT
jgi:hypothetical protein